MRNIGIIVDFDNIFPHSINQYSVEDIQRVLSFTIDSIRQKTPEIDRFIVRLYGGWFENNNLTPRASSISSMLPTLNSFFPILIQPKTIIHGNIELATQLYGHEYVWYNTYKEHAGLPKLRIDHSVLGSKCNSNPNTCPVKILKKFVDSKNRVCNMDGCTTIHSSVFFQRTQKYVDTMIACDIISMGTDDDFVGIYVLSDDVDHFPAFAVTHDLNKTEAKLGVFMTNTQNLDQYSSLLAPFEIDVTLIP